MHQSRYCLQSLLSASLTTGFLVLGTANADTLHRYTVRVDEDLNTVHVEACFDGTPPRVLQIASGEARRYLSDFRVVASGHRLYPDDRYVRLGRLDENACVRYRVDAGAAADRHKDEMGLATRVGNDLLVSPQLWFWRPRSMDADTDIELTFDLPDGMNVSVPWHTVERNGSRFVCHVGHTPYSWSAAVAFGDFEVQEISVDEMTLRVAMLDGGRKPDQDKMLRWLRAALENVKGAYGKLPSQSPQVVIVPIGEKDEPVPFGRVIRGGGGAVQFFVDPSYSLERFTGDWTATHELSHLLLPFVSRNGAWLSEGLATYYQNVLMARAGEYSEQKAWQKLHDGFQRGMRNTRRDQTLLDASRNMRRDGAYMRVYWTGTAIALLADMELRRRTGGQISLDLAMQRFADCCLPSDQTWQARDVMQRLDQLVGETVFVPLHDRYVESSDFPDLHEVYRALGVELKRDEVRLDDGAPLAKLREAIMTGKMEQLAHENSPTISHAP
jgi:hypothetical protein